MPAECYELVVSGVLAGQFVQNVLHSTVDNTGSTPPFQMADELLQTWGLNGDFVSPWCDILPDDYKITSLRCRRVLTTGGPTQIYLGANLAEDTGQRTGQISSSQVCPLLIWIGNSAPSKTGRTFLPGVSEDDINEMQMQASLLTAMDAFGTVWRDGGTTVNLSYAWGGAILRRGGPSADPITAFRVSPLIGTQRRRLRPV